MTTFKFIKLKGPSCGLIICIMLIIIIQMSRVKSYKPAPTTAIFQEPTIWLHGYRKDDALFLIPVGDEYRFQHQVQNEFVSKNGSDYVISETVSAFDFRCEANPVTWVFPFPNQIPTGLYHQIWTDEYRISELNPHTPDPVNIRYETVFVITTLGWSINFLSLNLTCKSTENKRDIASSIHIFVKDKHEIEHQDETIQVAAPKPDYVYGKTTTAPPLLIPCRPATPDLKIILQKNFGNGDSTQKKVWRPLPRELQDNLNFDPKYGFTLLRNSYANLVFGLYKCSVAVTSDDGNEYTDENAPFFLVNVTAAEKGTTLSNQHNAGLIFQPRSILHGKATAGLESGGIQLNPAFLCCTGNQSKPPKLFLRYCRDSVGCDMIKDSILGDIATGKAEEDKLFGYYNPDQQGIQKDCRREELYGESSVVIVCQAENVNFVDHWLQSFHPLSGGSVANRADRIRNARLHQNLETRSTIFRDFLPLEQYVSAATLESDETVARKMIMFAGTSTRGQRKFSGSRGNRRQGRPTYLWSSSAIENAYGMELDYEDDIYSRERLNYVYARGAFLRLNWTNGTNSLLAEPTTKIEKKAHLGRGAHVLCHLSDNTVLGAMTENNYPIFGTTILAKNGMSSVDCWMPKRNSRKWDKISKEIQVVPSLAPMFVEEEEEIQNFYVGDARHVINCTLQQGTPSPIMTVTRNGKRLRSVSRPTNGSNCTMPIHPKKGTIQTEILDKNEDTIAIKIYFSVIEHDDHGSVFQCNATNVNTTTTRTIRIFVNEKPQRTLLPVTLSGLAVLVLVLAALGVKHWCDKNSVRSLRNNNGQSLNR